MEVTATRWCEVGSFQQRYTEVQRFTSSKGPYTTAVENLAKNVFLDAPCLVFTGDLCQADVFLGARTWSSQAT